MAGPTQHHAKFAQNFAPYRAGVFAVSTRSDYKAVAGYDGTSVKVANRQSHALNCDTVDGYAYLLGHVTCIACA